MCGITGIFSFNELGRMHSVHLPQAVEALHHRGPDHQDFYQDGPIGLGHARLSIIDLRAVANQPMQDDTDRYTIIFNGEIYNFREIQQELENKGYAFHTTSDTEVLLKGWIAWGEALLPKLNGFFAFAIYDKAEASLVIVRDRMGIKPLYFYEDEDKVLFASELRSLLAYNIPKKLNHTALYAYLQLQYIPHPLSIFEGVQKLAPGHLLQIRKKEVVQKKWYHLPVHPVQGKPLSYKDYQKKLVSTLEDAVKDRLIADVPLGTFLSGGIDSSVITALASKHTEHLKTFSVSYPDDPFFDESRYAKEVAKQYNTEHTFFEIRKKDQLACLNGLLDHFDEPFADSSALPVYLLSEYTKKHVTVALSGDGADELFGGYQKHLGLYRSLHPGLLEHGVKGFLPLLKWLPQSRNGAFSNKLRQLVRFGEGMKRSLADRYWNWAALASQDEALQLLANEAKTQLHQEAFLDIREEYLQGINQNPSLDSLLAADCELVLPNDMLYKVDSMSMAHALEVRVPFLDYRVVQLAFQIPEQWKVNRKQRKIILQEAFRSMLPESLYHRPKHGFEVPLWNWMKTDLKPLITEKYLAPAFIQEQGLFDPEAITQLQKKLFSNNPGDAPGRVWALIVFQHWWQKNML